MVTLLAESYRDTGPLHLTVSWQFHHTSVSLLRHAWLLPGCPCPSQGVKVFSHCAHAWHGTRVCRSKNVSQQSEEDVFLVKNSKHAYSKTNPVDSVDAWANCRHLGCFLVACVQGARRSLRCARSACALSWTWQIFDFLLTEGTTSHLSSFDSRTRYTYN